MMNDLDVLKSITGTNAIELTNEQRIEAERIKSKYTENKDKKMNELEKKVEELERQNRMLKENP